jgi:AAA15 family ATPase/GTPase
MRHADLGIDDLEVSEDKHKHFTITQPAADHLESVTGTLTAGPVISGTSSFVAGTPLGFTSGLTFPPLYTIKSVRQSPSGEAIQFNFLEAESHGTQRFFALAGPLLDALDQGGLLVIDELGCSMHPTLTRKLIELFQTRDANQRGAQLVFSTQDSTLLDLELFRRDQLWIVEKDAAGASQLASLYDFEEKPRNNEALQRRYLAGRYGGVPVFGPTFEDLELK